MATRKAEYYLRQISLEYTLSPLQMSHAKERWGKLDNLLGGRGCKRQWADSPTLGNSAPTTFH